MGRLLLLLVVVSAAGASALFFGSADPAVAGAERRTYATAAEALAREVALTGLADAEVALLGSLAATNAVDLPLVRQGAHQGGAYRAEAVWADSVVVVTSAAVHGGAERTVRRSYRPRASAPPPFLVPTLLVDNHVQVRDPLEITAPPTANADVHANGNLQLGPVAVRVNGFGSASGRVHNRTGLPAPSVFLPNVNPAGLPATAEGAPPVPVPDVEPSRYRPQADRVLPRNSRLSGQYALGTRGSPALLYAEGNLTTSGAVTFSGWGVLVVEGNFQVDHPIVLSGGAANGQVLVVVGGHAQVRSPGLDVAGNWFVGGNAQLAAGARFTNGTLTVGNNLQLGGALTIAHRPVEVGVAGVVWPDHAVARSYREW